ncbi:DNA-binding protein [Serratia proteamaculans]|jgi:DNA-binding phage protein|uniref:DNA-binding protein n=1 Tax=Serratia proteamaculans TaxID=28151 RepID=UPI00101FC803|nr:DNA-binding protein [Serratia proteamaculans]RYM64725.1 DNA-binding protein [Serratia proteamaculans]
MKTLDEPIKSVGVSAVAKACGVSKRAVYKWLKSGCLPKSEFCGQTEYAETIALLSGGKYKASQMLDLSKKNWQMARHSA